MSGFGTYTSRTRITVAEPPRTLIGFLAAGYPEPTGGTGTSGRSLIACHNRPVDAPVYLVRHGQSEWNLLRLTQGQTMHPRLTALGRRQAEAAADLILDDLNGGPCHGIVSSDLVRAAETAEIIADRFEPAGRGPLEITYDKRLREHALGDLEGQPYAEGWSMADHPDWLDPYVRVGGGETVQEVYERIGSLLAETTGPVILVSHGDTIRAAYAWLRGLPVTEGSGVHITNGAVLRADQRRWLDP